MFEFWLGQQQAEPCFLEGSAALDRGDPDLALAWFDEAVRIDRHFALGHLGLGLARLRKGEYEAAICALSAAIRLSEDARAYFLRSLCYQGTGDSRREEADYLEAVRRNPRVETSMQLSNAKARNSTPGPMRLPRQADRSVQRCR